MVVPAYGRTTIRVPLPHFCSVYCARPTVRGVACMNRKHGGVCFNHNGNRREHQRMPLDRGRGYIPIQPYELLDYSFADILRLRTVCLAIEKLT